jgi:hypothetical protein
MKMLVASVLKRSTMVLAVMLFLVCTRAEAQCGYLMLAEIPDPVGFVHCTETVYGPPTETEMVLLETVITTESLYQYALNGPLNEWSWTDFYGCWLAIASGSAVGNWITWIGGAAVSGASFVGAVTGGAFGCALAEINWYW